jgi:outer membrane protein OmpA-like peptidoglycan-associated protein
LLTDAEGRVSWEYLGLQLGDVQWLMVKDESDLLADNSGLVYSPLPSNRPPTPTVLFQKNQSALEDVYTKELIELSMYLLLHPMEKVKLMGSYDAVGDLASNERLAWERAFSVQSFLMAHGTLLNQIDVEITIPLSSGMNVKDRKVEIAFQ